MVGDVAHTVFVGGDYVKFFGTYIAVEDVVEVPRRHVLRGSEAVVAADIRGEHTGCLTGAFHPSEVRGHAAAAGVGFGP